MTTLRIPKIFKNPKQITPSQARVDKAQSRYKWGTKQNMIKINLVYTNDIPNYIIERW